MNQVALSDGSIALVGNVEGRADIVQIAANGITTFTQATVQIVMGPNGPMHIISEIGQ